MYAPETLLEPISALVLHTYSSPNLTCIYPISNVTCRFWSSFTHWAWETTGPTNFNRKALLPGMHWLPLSTTCRSVSPAQNMPRYSFVMEMKIFSERSPQILNNYDTKSDMILCRIKYSDVLLILCRLYSQQWSPTSQQRAILMPTSILCIVTCIVQIENYSFPQPNSRTTCHQSK